ncbi:Retrotransposon protein, Ty3-gypsy subclass [Gossypium australe]|uniref:Retrotransposon protein, Ty3-gypsy subclass n=1 Tax=Gossypium australe TaxID=47621 RepID=A0A5B6WQU5_9ROSI|nr:Retrotransposon protein, Ty3-gypsy subclass [Gossypium australe]
MSPYEALYGCKCRTPLCWIILGERKETLKAASDRQKSYEDLKRKDIEYSVGDQGKLSPQFIGPYQILRRIDTVAYQLKLPPELD